MRCDWPRNARARGGGWPAPCVRRLAASGFARITASFLQPNTGPSVSLSWNTVAISDLDRIVQSSAYTIQPVDVAIRSGTLNNCATQLALCRHVDFMAGEDHSLLPIHTAPARSGQDSRCVDRVGHHIASRREGADGRPDSPLGVYPRGTALSPRRPPGGWRDCSQRVL